MLRTIWSCSSAGYGRASVTAGFEVEDSDGPAVRRGRAGNPVEVVAGAAPGAAGFDGSDARPSGSVPVHDLAEEAQGARSTEA